MTRRKRLYLSVPQTSLALALALPSGAVVADEREPWQVTVGAGVAQVPEYPGSDQGQTRALPLLSVRYGRFFLGSVPEAGSLAGLGAYLYRGESWRIGAIVSGELMDPRQEADDPHLRGVGDINATARAGMFASYAIGWLTLRGSVASDVADNQQGTLATFDAEARYRPVKRLVLSAGPGVTWANSQHAETFFGIDAQQAASSGLAQYTPKSGVDLVRFSVGASYELTRHWNLGTRLTAARLQGDAMGENFAAPGQRPDRCVGAADAAAADGDKQIARTGNGRLCDRFRVASRGLGVDNIGTGPARVFRNQLCRHRGA